MVFAVDLVENMARKIPLHRRLLPWSFALVFLIFAPILVFYTAGYRWNPKKGVVERNGTVIVDTKPTSVDIYLNRQKSTAKSPATLQNIAPGTYLIQLEKEGYHAWRKTLSVLPEMVTFANKIILWPTSEPEIILEKPVTSIFANNAKDTVLGFIDSDNDKQEIFILKKNQIVSQKVLDYRIQPKSTAWNLAGTTTILEGYVSSTAGQWLLISDPLQFTSLPEGSFHFEGTQLVGMDEEYKILLEKNGSLSKQKNSEYTIDAYNDFSIKKIPGQDNLILITNKNAEEGLILPRGDWRFYTLDRNEILLRSGTDWLRLSISSYPFTSTQAKAENIYPMILSKQTAYLLKQNNELYLWMPDEEPELLHRQSDPIVSAGWHQQGFDIFYATKNEIRILNLDNRDGRLQTTVAWFDEIFDATLAENAIFVAGRKNEQTGLWKYTLTRTSAIPPISTR
jgi:hypothetical protein